MVARLLGPEEVKHMHDVFHRLQIIEATTTVVDLARKAIPHLPGDLGGPLRGAILENDFLTKGWERGYLGSGVLDAAETPHTDRVERSTTESTGPPIQGPAARMRCRRCDQVFTVEPGRMIAHDRRQGAVYIHCDGELVPDLPDAIGQADTSGREA